MGPAHTVLSDLDGKVMMLEQHVLAPLGVDRAFADGDGAAEWMRAIDAGVGM